MGHFWTTTQSHIYKALKDLEKQGWVEKEIIEQEDKPNRKRVFDHETGCAELHHWLTTPLQPAPVREAWLIQLFFSQTSTDEEINALIEERGKKFVRSQIHIKSNPGGNSTRPAARNGSRPGTMADHVDYGIAFYSSN